MLHNGSCFVLEVRLPVLRSPVVKGDSGLFTVIFLIIVDV